MGSSSSLSLSRGDRWGFSLPRDREGMTRTGYLIEEQGMSYLAQAESDGALTPLQAAACTDLIAA